MSKEGFLPIQSIPMLHETTLKNAGGYKDRQNSKNENETKVGKHSLSTPSW